MGFCGLEHTPNGLRLVRCRRSRPFQGFQGLIRLAVRLEHRCGIKRTLKGGRVPVDGGHLARRRSANVLNLLAILCRRCK